MNALIKNGVQVHRTTSPLNVGGKTYPAGSYVVKTAQAFRPHVLDMFEPQDHPERLPVSGRSADSALRQRRLDARLSDGREVRSHRRRRYRRVEPVGMNLIKPAGRPRRRSRQCGGLHRQPRRQRRVHRHQPPAQGGRGSVLRARSLVAESGRHGRDLHHRSAVDAGACSRPQQPISACRSPP